MDNDRKMNFADERDIGALVETTKKWFMATREEFARAQEKYDLEREFAGTRKNRHVVVTLTVVLTCLVFVGFAWFMVATNEANNKVTVQSKDFDDINQRDLLNSVTKVESDLAYTDTQLKQLQTDRSLALKKVDSDYADAMSLARTKYLDPVELKQKLSAIDAKHDTARARINADFEARTTPLLAEITRIKAELAGFDSKKVASAKAQAVVLNSERKLFDMEKQRLSIAYETQIDRLIASNNSQLAQKDAFIGDLARQAKDTLTSEQNRLTSLYNPTFSDPELQALLNRALDEQRLASFQARISRTYLKDSLVSQTDLDLLNHRLAEYRTISDRLVRTPYINSVPPMLRQMQFRSLEILDTAVSFFDAFWKTVQAREATIREREATIQARDATIQEREATIREREAAIADQASQIERLNGDLGALKAELGATQQKSASDLAHSLSAYEAKLKQVAQQAMVVDVSDPAQPAVYIRPEAGFADNQDVYALRNGTDMLGEFIVRGGGSIRLLEAVAPAAPSRNAPKPLAPYDWVVRKEDYVYSRVFPNAPKPAAR